jgi:hypothetical protein
MSTLVDFKAVSTVGLESSPVVAELAGLRANEARYLKNKYDHDFAVEPASKAKATIDRVKRILKEERGIVIASRPLEATTLNIQNMRWDYVFYESGLSINVLYAVDDATKRAVGFKLSEGMEVPTELASFKRLVVALRSLKPGSFAVRPRRQICRSAWVTAPPIPRPSRPAALPPHDDEGAA